MATPDYSLGMVQPTQLPQQFAQGAQLGVGLGEAMQATQDRARLIAAQDAAAKAAADAAAKAARDKAQQQADYLAAIDKGLDADSVLRFQAKWPSAAEQITKSWKLKSEAEQKQYVSQAQTLLAAGASDPKKAAEIAKRYADAHRNTPGMQDQAEALDRLSDQLVNNEKDAQFALANFLGAAMEPKDFAETMAKVNSAKALGDKAKSDAEKAGVEARLTEKTMLAKIALDKANTARLYDLSRLDSRRLGLEEEKVRNDAAKIMLEAGVTGGLSKDAQKLVTEASVDAASASQEAEAVSKVAELFSRKTDKGLVTGTPFSGAPAVLGRFAAAATGTSTEETRARQQYRGLIEKLVSSDLKGAGAITDSERDAARSTYPSADGDYDAIYNFLKAREEKILERRSSRRAEVDYVSQNGSLAPARQPLVVGGVEVRAGETLDDALTRIRANEAVKKEAPAVDALRNKYKKAP